MLKKGEVLTKYPPFFSIIIPLYNVEMYLDECIQSVLSQTFSSFELLLVDDGSDDGSGEICDKYKKEYEEKICVIHKKNGGQSSARNAGLEKYIGKYVMFLDSDDILLDNTVLDRIYKQITEQDIVAFPWKEFSTGDNIKNISVVDIFSGVQTNSLMRGKSFLSTMLRIHPEMPWYSWMYVYKSTYIQNNNLKFMEGHLFEDVMFTPNALLGAKWVSILPYPVYGYRVKRQGSTTGLKKLNKYQDMLYAAKYNIQKIQKRYDISGSLQKSLCSSFANLYFAAMISVYALPNKKEQYVLIQNLKQDKWVADYARGKKQVVARILIKLIGFMPTVWILNFRRRIMEGK